MPFYSFRYWLNIYSSRTSTMIGRTDPLLCYDNILNRKLPAIKSLPKFMVQNNYLVLAIFIAFFLYLYIDKGRWQTRLREVSLFFWIRITNHFYWLLSFYVLWYD